MLVGTSIDVRILAEQKTQSWYMGAQISLWTELTNGWVYNMKQRRSIRS